MTALLAYAIDDAGLWVPLAAGTAPSPPPPPPPGTAAFPGHVPGRTYAGLADGGSNAVLAGVEASCGLQGIVRVYAQWGGDAAEDAEIRAHHAAGRLPWVNVAAKSIPAAPSGSGLTPLGAIIRGDQDAALRAKAARYAGYSKPVLVSFFGEPERRSWLPAEYQAAHVHIADVLKSVPGCWPNIGYGPCLMDYDWDPVSGRQPSDWITPAMAAASTFIGVDSYDPWGLQKLKPNGTPMTRQTLEHQMSPVLATLRQVAPGLPVLIGETGTSHDPANPIYQANWIAAAWAFCTAQPDVAALCWFDFAPTTDADTTFDTAGLSAWATVSQSPKSVRLADAGL